MFKGILLAGLVLLAAACTVTPAASSVATRAVQESRLVAVLGNGARRKQAACVRSGAGDGTAGCVRSSG